MKLLIPRSAFMLLVIFTATFLVAHQPATAQPPKKIRKVVPLLTQQTFYLNGGMRATFGGKSRTTYQGNLPKNPVER